MTKFEQIQSVKSFHDLANQGLVIVNEGKRLMLSALEGLLALQPNRTISVETLNLDAKLAWNATNPSGYEDDDDISIIALTLVCDRISEDKDISVRYSYISRITNKPTESKTSLSLVSNIDPYDIIDAYMESMQGEEMELEDNITMDTLYLTNGKQVDTRLVYVPELDSNVLVASESVGEEIEEGSADDDNFYAYVPDHEFSTLTDDELVAWLDKYIN